MSPNEFHTVSVPVEDLEAVYELLADRSRARAAASSVAPTQGPQDDLSRRGGAKDDVWTDDLLERVAAGDTISTQVLTDIMDVIARDPRGIGKYNREQLVAETGHSAGRVTATFTKLTPHFRKHYGTDWWPVIGESGSNFTPPRAGTYYWMTPTVLERWKRIRSI